MARLGALQPLSQYPMTEQFLTIKVIPNAPKTIVVGRMDDGTWKIKVKAVPQKGKANKELIRFLSKELGVAKSDISITSGETSRLKRVRVSNCNAEDVQSLGE